MSREASYLFYSDFNCPFCYALNERLVALAEPGLVRWRGIQHYPHASSQDRSLEVQLATANDVSMVRRRAPEVLIEVPPFVPSTRRVNLLVASLVGAADPAALCELRTLIYRAYWRGGEDIEDPRVLAALCRAAGVEPVETSPSAPSTLAAWQTEWEGERFHNRLPAMLATRSDRPLLGFPALDVLCAFVSELSLPIAPESLAGCELKPRQHLLLVGPDMAGRANLTELKPAYLLHFAETMADARASLAEAPCAPDLVVIDLPRGAEEGYRYCLQLRKDPRFRTVPIVALTPPGDLSAELAAFDAGATDVVFDLSHPKIAQARLEHHLRLQRSSALLAAMARFDFITELPNRREFDRRLDAEWSRARRRMDPIGVCMIDIDHFKLFNDAYGHACGDDALRRVAAAIQSCARRTTDLAARYGGEEFVVILAGTTAAEAAERAAAMCAAVEALGLPHAASPTLSVVTVSIGVAACVPPDEAGSSGLVRTADAALYRAKSTGRNRWAGAGTPRPREDSETPDGLPASA